MNVNTKNDEFKDAVSVASTVDVMEDTNEQSSLWRMSKLLQNTYVDIEKVTDRNKKDVWYGCQL